MNMLRIRIGGVQHAVRPDMSLLLQIEQELGALPALAQTFRGQGWHVADLVSLLHIILQHSGKTPDYLVLGNLVLQNGLDEAHRMALAFFDFLRLPLQDPENPTRCAAASESCKD